MNSQAEAIILPSARTILHTSDSAALSQLGTLFISSHATTELPLEFHHIAASYSLHLFQIEVLRIACLPPIDIVRMLTRTVLGRLATELSRTRPCDVTHLSQRLNSLRNTLNGIIPSPRRLVRGAQPFHTSIQYLASRGTNTTRKTGRTSVRKTASKRAPTKKTTTGKRSGVRRKAASKAKKRPTKRVPSEKAKLKLAAQKKRDEITGLKETALLSSEPKTSPTSAWSVLITEYVRGEKGSVNTRFKEAATKFRDLSPSEREVCIGLKQ